MTGEDQNDILSFWFDVGQGVNLTSYLQVGDTVTGTTSSGKSGGGAKRRHHLTDILELLTKSSKMEAQTHNRMKKDAQRRHAVALIIRFRFIAVAERRQWSSAASKPRRKTRVRLCSRFCAAKVPSHQICRFLSAS